MGSQSIEKELCQLHRAALARAEVQLHALALYPLEQRLHKLLAYAVAAEVESQRVYAAVQYVEGLGVAFLGVFHLKVLAHVPRVVVLLVAAHERKFARQRVGGLELQHVFPAVERLHRKAFVCSPYQLLVEVGALQVGLNLVKPLLGRRSLELGKEFFSVV